MKKVRIRNGLSEFFSLINNAFVTEEFVSLKVSYSMNKAMPGELCMLQYKLLWALQERCQK